MKKKILFITWDGPQTSYMEGLFMPIFSKIGRKEAYEFHVLQFTWADQQKANAINTIAQGLGIKYTPVKIFRWPAAGLGSLYTLFTSSGKIKEYIQQNNIDIIMPRSVFPAVMVNQLNFGSVVYDADGLVIEERIESGSLKRNSIFHQFLVKQELKIVSAATAVLTRSDFAINYYAKLIPKTPAGKFFRVVNGRDSLFFSFSESNRNRTRNSLGFCESDIVLIYLGSLGGKYQFDKMRLLYEKLKEHSDHYKFLVVTNSKDIIENLSAEDKADIKFVSVPFTEVNTYLSASDLGLCIISQSLSMTSAAATKLGEYFLAGLPVVSTSRIGDMDHELCKQDFCFLLEDNTEEEIVCAAEWIINSGRWDRKVIGEFGIKNFSLEVAADSYIRALKYMSSQMD